VAGRLIGILALSTNNWGLMKPHVAAIVQAVEEVKPGEVRNLFCGRFHTDEVSQAGQSATLVHFRSQHVRLTD
jgi:hypothetical protein